MRVTPLAVWGHKLSKDDLYHAVRYQTMFTHANPTAINATYLYCYAISILINKDYSQPGKGKEIVRMIIEEAKARQEGTERIDEWLSAIEETEYPTRTEALPPPT